MISDNRVHRELQNLIQFTRQTYCKQPSGPFSFLKQQLGGNLCAHTLLVSGFVSLFLAVYLVSWISSLSNSHFKALPTTRYSLSFGWSCVGGDHLNHTRTALVSKKSLWAATVTSSFFAISVLWASAPLFHDEKLLADPIFGIYVAVGGDEISRPKHNILMHMRYRYFGLCKPGH